MRTDFSKDVANLDKIIDNLAENEKGIIANISSDEAIANLKEIMDHNKIMVKINEIIDCLATYEESTELSDSDNENIIAHIETLKEICDTAVNGKNGKKLLENPIFLIKMDEVDRIVDRFMYPSFLSPAQNELAKPTLGLPGLDLARVATAPLPKNQTPNEIEEITAKPSFTKKTF